jgi:HPr kinase/phosphorylase
MPDRMDGSSSVHASCVALDGAGILIRGASGSGKSTLALLLLDRAALADLPAGLVGDDRIRLTREGETVVARPHPALGDRIEVRGLGLLRGIVAEPSAPMRLVVDLVEARPRLPASSMTSVTMLGLALPSIVLDRALLQSGLAPRLVLDALAGCPGVARGTHRPVLTFPPGPGP